MRRNGISHTCRVSTGELQKWNASNVVFDGYCLGSAACIFGTTFYPDRPPVHIETLGKALLLQRLTFVPLELKRWFSLSQSKKVPILLLHMHTPIKWNKQIA